MNIMSSLLLSQIAKNGPHTGLPRSMWAAAVPANYERQLGALIEDIYGDHQLMVDIIVPSHRHPCVLLKCNADSYQQSLMRAI